MIILLLSWAITIRASDEISDSRIACQTLWFPRTQVERAEYGALAEAGVKWVRLGLPWDYCEGDTGVYSFDHMDWIVDTLASLGIQVFICIGGNNPIYSAVSPTPADPYYFSRYLAFVDTAAALFGDRVKAWEAWNEANIDGVWIPYDPAAYAATACSTAAHIKARVPDAFCVLTGTALVDVPFIRTCLLAGAGNYFDAVAFHPYRAWPEIDQDTCTVWYPNPDFISPYDSYREEVEALGDTVDKYAPGLVLWDTEGGYLSDTISWNPFSPGGQPMDYTETTQAKCLARHYILNIALDIKMTTWTSDWDFQSLYGNMGRETWVNDYRDEDDWDFSFAPFFGLTYVPPESLGTYSLQGEDFDSVIPHMQHIWDGLAEGLACVGVLADSAADGAAHYVLSPPQGQALFWGRTKGSGSTLGIFAAQLDTIAFSFGNWGVPDSYRWYPSAPIEIHSGPVEMWVFPLYADTRFDAARITHAPRYLERKKAWWALAYTASVFDEHVLLDSTGLRFYNLTADTFDFNRLEGLSFVDTLRGARWIPYWFGIEAHDTRPPDSLGLRIMRTDVQDPYLVDLLSGQAWPITGFTLDDSSAYFPSLPVNDYPMAIAWGGYVQVTEGAVAPEFLLLGSVVRGGFLQVLSTARSQAWIYDITGRKAMGLVLEPGRNRISVKGFSPGVYFLVPEKAGVMRFVVVK